MQPDLRARTKVAASAGDLEDGAAPGQRAAAAQGSLYLCIALASMGAFAFGYHLGVVNGPLEAIAASLGFAGNAALQGTVVSSILVGATLGSFLGGSLADAYGRRQTLLFNAIPLLAGALLCANAVSLATIVAGRVLCGIGIGVASALVPLYISEVAPAAQRGALGSVNQLVICIGIVSALVVNIYVPAAQWRAMFAVAAVPAALLGLGMAFVCPETPAHLRRKGRGAEAAAAADQLWGSGGSATLASESAGSPGAEEGVNSIFGLFQPPYRRAAVTAVTLYLIQQFAGINAIVYFSSSVFRAAGVGSATIASAAVGVANVVGTLIAGQLLDREGRKPLLMRSLTLMGASMALLAASMVLDVLKPYAAIFAVTGTIAYVLAFALGSGPVPALLSAEIFPSRARGTGMSLTMVTHWVCNFCVGQMFLPAVAVFGLPSVYAFFGLVAVVGSYWVNANVVETKGRSLQEIEKLMGTSA